MFDKFDNAYRGNQKQQWASGLRIGLCTVMSFSKAAKAHEGRAAQDTGQGGRVVDAHLPGIDTQTRWRCGVVVAVPKCITLRAETVRARSVLPGLACG